MNFLQLKHGFRANRAIGFSACFYLGLGVFNSQHSLHTVLTYVGLGITLALLGGNEVVFRTVKQFKKLDPLTAERFSVLLPISLFIGLSSLYLLSGQLGLFLLLSFAVLQSQFYNHPVLTKTLLTGMVALYGLSMLLQYPFTIGESHVLTPGILMLLFTPFVLTMLQFGELASALVRNSTDKVAVLQSLAATDGLTGLINRRQFNHQLQSEIARASRSKTKLSLALFDIDDFKKINDHYGHPVGDRILQELGIGIKNNVRESDIPARYGGEEFALILPETSQMEAYDILERLRAMIEHTVFCLPDNPITMTISIGLAQMDHPDMTAFELIEKADNALYEAKRQGKNRVVYGVIKSPKIDLKNIKPSFDMSGSTHQNPNTAPTNSEQVKSLI